MELIPLLVLTIIGYLSGSIIERRHFRSIRERESQLIGILTFSAKLPPAEDFDKQSVLVLGGKGESAMAIWMAHSSADTAVLIRDGGSPKPYPISSQLWSTTTKPNPVARSWVQAPPSMLPSVYHVALVSSLWVATVSSPLLKDPSGRMVTEGSVSYTLLTLPSFLPLLCFHLSGSLFLLCFL